MEANQPQHTAKTRTRDEVEKAGVTQCELGILRHTIGADEFGQRRSDRNHFVTGVGSTDHPLCVSLVEKGFMDCREKFALAAGDDVFWVTDAGMDVVRMCSKPIPKLTRAQRRYREWLAADSDWTFGEWIKHGFGQAA